MSLDLRKTNLSGALFRPFVQSFADCLSGIVPALVGILATQSSDATTGTVKPAVFVAKLKETMKEGGWGLTLIESMIQDTREE